ncbi:MAG TPA: TIGR02391 family protein [Iamia sp.]|nr:TIGR02391 family protein [Iamia sp.]
MRRIALERLHPEVIAAASDLFVDEHYSQAVFEACKALEVRVRAQSGLELSGRVLMDKALGGQVPPINVAVEEGQSGRDEQEGIRFLLMGVMQGIRNPKGHGLIRQDDPQRALEYLALVSILFRRLDDGAGAEA